MSKPAVELLIHNCGELITMQGSAPHYAQDDAGIVTDGMVAVAAGRIVAAGHRWDVESRVQINAQTRYYDAGNHLVTPGLVDPHTHLCYAGSRQHELALRLQGHSYLDILASGGGILHTVRATRSASDAALKGATRRRLQRLLAHGVTSLEIKSGYGLGVEEELRQLHLIAELADEGPQRIVSTFMGAHAVPPEFAHDTAGYVELVVEEMLPQAAALARFCDVFCEEGVFTVAQSRHILQRARELGLGLKVHADELSAMGGAQLAAELGAISAEHLLMIDQEGIQALSRSQVMAVLLPGTSFYLGKSYAPARRLLAAGVPVALATDSNPGSSPTENPQLMLNLAALHLQLTPVQAWAGLTINAACAIGLQDEVGSLTVGKRADIVVFDAPDHEYVPYHYGNNLVQAVFCGGELVVEG